MPNIGTRQNNPGNIKSGPLPVWQGQTGTKNGFAVFESPVMGVRAGLKLLSNYYSKGYNTLRKILDRYAPNHNQINYLQYLSDKTGIGPDVVFQPTAANFKKIFKYMIVIEIGQSNAEKFWPYLDSAWELAKKSGNPASVSQAAENPDVNWLLLGGMAAGGLALAYTLYRLIKNRK